MISDINMPTAARRTKRQPPSRTRPYSQARRAELTRANGEQIVAATVDLIKRSGRVAHVTLDDIARASGLTVRTVLRRFGSRDGTLEAAFVQMSDEFGRLRVQTPPGDVDAAIASLVSQYEAIGPLNIRALEEEDQLPLLHRMLTEARRFHRAWLGRVFEAQLASLHDAERERRLTALYAATDVYLWKLLRRDLKCGRSETEDILRRLVRGVLP